MSLNDYENVIIKAHDMGALWLDPKDTEDRDRLINAYAVEIHFKSGLTRSNLYVSLTPQDLSAFAEYLRTKVPEVHRN